MPIILTKEKVEEAYNKIRSSKASQLLSFMQNKPYGGWMRNCKCPTCNQNVIGTTLKGEQDWNEFSISGMCQTCIDKTFSSE